MDIFVNCAHVDAIVVGVDGTDTKYISGYVRSSTYASTTYHPLAVFCIPNCITHSIAAARNILIN